MVHRRLSALWLLAGLSLFVVLPVFAAKPDGKGNGGGDTEPPLPADLDVRYHVRLAPIPVGATDAAMFDLNDSYEMVGRYEMTSTIEVPNRTGYYFNGLTGAFLTTNDMIALPDRWVSSEFHGINNKGAIVGLVWDENGVYNGLLIYPTEAGLQYDLVSIPGTQSCGLGKVNDSGDIVGVYADADGNSGAFAFNPGIYAPGDSLVPAPFGPASFTDWSTLDVTATRRGIAGWPGYNWFDFPTAQPSPVVVPAGAEITNAGNVGVSDDGHIATTETVQVRKKQYTYTPGVVFDGVYVWRGSTDDGRAELVNLASGSNGVGDIVGFNRNAHVRWLRYADHPEWGYLNLESMLVVQASDAEQWSALSNPVGVWSMSNREPFSAFPVLAGHSYGFDPVAVYMLVPELLAP